MNFLANQWKVLFLVMKSNYFILHFGHDSVAGKQVHEIPSTSVGGSLFCVALSSRGMDIQKVCLIDLRCCGIIFFVRFFLFCNFSFTSNVLLIVLFIHLCFLLGNRYFPINL